MRKNALITGANSGIGLATARLFKERGYEVTLLGRNREGLAEVGQALDAPWIVADIARAEDLARAAGQFADGGLDVLVNNAALARFIPLADCGLGDYDEFFATNIRGPLYLTQLLLPALAMRQGSVVNVSSVVTRNGLANAALYAATKGAMEAYSKSLAVELAPQGIRVNVVAPGAVDTPILAKLGVPPDVLAAIRAQQEATIPLRRYGRPEEIAQVILAQAEATYVTGAVWVADGGVDAV